MKKYINEDWFYTDPNPILRLLTVFIKGDGIILIPFILFTTLFLFINLELGLILGLVFISLRFLGEMFYWFLQQFSKREYRPFDFGLSNLSNNSIYIIYQLFSLCLSTIGISLLIYILKYF